LRSPAVTLGVFAVTLFLSATLLFLVQPMIGKMMLPHLGGTPAVWNTCMVFFQAVLLLGYSYAHATTTWLSPRFRLLLHAIILVIPVIVFPIRIAETWAPAGESNPIPAVLGLLFVTAGLPFFVVSTTAPLLQKWFAGTDHPQANDPYFLYGASNLGSMLALVAYPAIVEPHLKVDAQSVWWSFGYGLLAVLVLCCAAVVWLSPAPEPALAGEKKFSRAARGAERGTRSEGGTALRTARSTSIKGARNDGSAPFRAPRSELEPAPTPLERLRWVALAFVPSSLMLGATTYITTDIAAIPLLWVLPLGLYLISFILVFSRLPDKVHKVMVVALPLLILLQMFIMMSNLGKLPMWGRIGIHLVVLFVTAMVCHGELARRRPATRYLTEYYLLMSLGGVLGGAFNALLAPIVFNGIVEYPLALVLACLMLPRSPDEDPSGEARFKDFGYPAALGVLSLILISELLTLDFQMRTVLRLFAIGPGDDSENPNALYKFVMDNYKQVEGSFAKIVRFGIPVVICYTFVDRPLRLALGVGAILLAYGYVERSNESIMLQERSFFGVLKVEADETYHSLTHGTTLHGKQRYNADRRTLVFCGQDVGAALMLASTDPLNAATYVLGTEAAYWAGEEPEWFDPRREALTYYHRTGPIGQVMRAFRGEKRKPHYAVIGLGTGTMASYGEPGQRLTYYDIDKHVVDIANNPRYFTYLKDARERGVKLDIVLGDARVEMRKAVKEKDNPHHNDRYGVIVVDAFSSDAIPIHLITKEAIREVYLPLLDKGGILAFHISNRHLDLEPVLGNLAKDKEVNLIALVQHDGKEEDYPGKAASTWVLLVHSLADLGDLEYEGRPDYEPLRKFAQGMSGEDPWSDEARRGLSGGGFWANAAYTAIQRAGPRWKPAKTDPKVGIWTDDYSNLLSVFNWR
jgi:hypothetical protein